MRKLIASISLGIALAFVSFYMEPIFPLGDGRWLVIAVLAASPAAWLYRNEMLSAILRKKKKAWEIPGARKPIFKLYEAACLLHGIDPAWPLPGQLSIEELDHLIHAVIVSDPEVKTVDLRVVIPDKAIRPSDPSDIAGRQHMYITELRIGAKRNDSRFNKASDREALHNVEVERKALREYLKSQSRDIPYFLDERFDARP